LNSGLALDRKISVAEIQSHSKPIILSCYQEFLRSSLDDETREYESPYDQVREVLIHGHYFSQKDIEFCKDLPSEFFDALANPDEARQLHACLIFYYVQNM